MDVCSSTASPSAAAVVCTSNPVLVPSAEMAPARRPCPMPRASTYRLSGPGATISASEAVKKSARFAVSMAITSHDSMKVYAHRLAVVRGVFLDVAVGHVAAPGRGAVKAHVQVYGEGKLGQPQH